MTNPQSGISRAVASFCQRWGELIKLGVNSKNLHFFATNKDSAHGPILATSVSYLVLWWFFRRKRKFCSVKLVEFERGNKEHRPLCSLFEVRNKLSFHQSQLLNFCSIILTFRCDCWSGSNSITKGTQQGSVQCSLESNSSRTTSPQCLMGQQYQTSKFNCFQFTFQGIRTMV